MIKSDQMVNKNIVILVCLSLFLHNAVAQEAAQFIDSVKLNHPALISLGKLNEVSRAVSRTGLYPPGPELSAGWFPGNSDAAGIKRTWSVSQSFDFPTAYFRIAELKRTNLDLALAESRLLETQILTNAGIAVIEYTAMLKRIGLVEGRVEHMKKYEDMYSMMVETGEATILDFNRIKAETVILKSTLATLTGEASAAAIRLDYISNNNSQLITGEMYPDFPVVGKESLLKEKREIHPAFAVSRLRIEKAGAGLKLNRSSQLPGITVGYGSESVAGQEFTGPQLGLSIPLWNKSGTVNAVRAELFWEESQSAADISALENEIVSLLNEFEAVSSNLIEVEEHVNGSEAIRLLNISLQSGAITLTDYLSGLQDFWAVEELLLNLEREKMLLLTEIWDHRW